MRMTSVVAWVVGAVVGGLGAAASCAQSGGSACDVEACGHDCVSMGYANGECRGGACQCMVAAADADADAPRPDVADDGDASADAEGPDLRLDDGRAEACDEAGGGESGGETGGDGSGSCDPVLCMISCGGICDASGNCVCPGEDAGDGDASDVPAEIDGSDDGVVETEADVLGPEADAAPETEAEGDVGGDAAEPAVDSGG